MLKNQTILAEIIASRADVKQINSINKKLNKRGVL